LKGNDELPKEIEVKKKEIKLGKKIERQSGAGKGKTSSARLC